MDPQGPVLYILFPHIVHNWVNSIDLSQSSLILSYAVSILTLNPSTDIFILVILFFSFVIFIHFITSVSLLIFPVFSFVSREFGINYWWIFMTAALKSLSYVPTTDSCLFWHQLIFQVCFSWFLVQWMFYRLHPGYFGCWVRYSV